MKIARRPRPAPWLPFITLADIAWQLIVFFLLAATFVAHWSLRVPLPSAGPVPSSTISRTIRVEAGESTLRVNGMNIPLADLELQITGLLAGATSEGERAVLVVPADDLTFQRNADILYAVQQAGGVVLISDQRTPSEKSQASPARATVRRRSP